MKQVTHATTYAGTTVEAVFAMLGDPAYRRAVGEHQEVTDFSCAIEPTGSGMQVRLEQAHDTDGIPAFAQRMVGSEIRFVQEESWPSAAGGDIHIAIPGKPGDISGSTTLSQTGADVVRRVELAVKVSIPLVGGKVEDLVAGFLTRALDAEAEVGTGWR
jgi:hypothetical protein